MPRRSKRSSIIKCQGQKRKRSLDNSFSPDVHYKQRSILDFLEIKDPNVFNNFTPPFNVNGRRSGTPRDFSYYDFDKVSVTSDNSSASSYTNSSSGYGSKHGTKRQKFSTPGPNKNNEYKIENIISIEVKESVPLFQVKWVGYPSSRNTWEPLDHVRDTDSLESFLTRESIKNKDDLDEMVLELTKDVDFSVPKDSTQWQNLLKEIESLDEIQLQADLIVLTMAKIYDKGRYSKRMYQRAKGNLITKHFKDIRSDQLSKISEWSKMINEKEPGSKIQVINDVDFDAPPEDFVYVNSNVAGEGVVIPDEPMVFCNCADGCSYKSECCGKLMQSRFAYRSNRSIRIPTGVPIFECNSKCSCPPDCPNRIVQQGRKHKLNIFKTHDGRGWGVRTEKYIPEGHFICEYTGEIITFEEAERRGTEYDSAGNTYLFDLDFNNVDNNFTIDALHYGNIARFINHSCDPNCGIWALWSDCQDPNFQKIIFFSLRPIESGEELTIDYLNGKIIDGNDNDTSVNETKDESLEIEDGENICPNSQSDNPIMVTMPSEVPPVEPVVTPLIVHEKFRPNSVINKETCVCKCGAKNCRKYIF